MTAALKESVAEQMWLVPGCRLTAVLSRLGVNTSSWYRRPTEHPRRPGPSPQPVDPEVAAFIEQTALDHPWYGYHKIAVICRWQCPDITDRTVYKVMKQRRLLLRRPNPDAALNEARKLFELKWFGMAEHGV